MIHRRWTLLKSNTDLFFLLFSIFCVCFSTYVITPLLPIYFTESASQQGLCWTKNEAFSVYGTFLALLYTAPFLGSLLSIFVLGRSRATLCGYVSTLLGIFVLYLFPTRKIIPFALFFLGFGFGNVKVNVTALFGSITKKFGKKVYDFYYLSASLGFITGGLFSNIIFTQYGIKGNLLAVVIGTIASATSFLLFSERKLPDQITPFPEQKKQLPISSTLFAKLLIFSMPFFICTSQITTSIPIFLHQNVNRTIFGWTVPSLWVGAVGSLVMLMLSPYVLKYWNNQKNVFFKISAGFGIIATAFALVIVATKMESCLIPNTIILTIFLCAGILSSIADFHIRPILFASATNMISIKYHTISTGFVYLCVGLGGKLAGTLVSYVDSIGFSMVFGICFSIAFTCFCISFFWIKNQPLLKSYAHA